MHSGCTAVTAFLRLEDADGKQSFLPPNFDPFQSSVDMIEAGSSDDSDTNSNATGHTEEHKKKSSRSKIKNALRHIRSGSSPSPSVSSEATSSSATRVSPSSPIQAENIFTPNVVSNIRRVLYCANAGDARGVLCRSGKAIRLTYDHKGSDKQEAKRIVDAGGFVLSGRVNGVLAVTRSLGDSSMKEFVVGAPYTTETVLCEEDEFLILACDGVCFYLTICVDMQILIRLQLWDVVDDQEAVARVRQIADPKEAAKILLDQAYTKYSSDNVTVLVVRFRPPPS